MGWSSWLECFFLSLLVTMIITRSVAHAMTKQIREASAAKVVAMNSTPHSTYRATNAWGTPARAGAPSVTVKRKSYNPVLNGVKRNLGKNPLMVPSAAIVRKSFDVNSCS